MDGKRRLQPSAAAERAQPPGRRERLFAAVRFTAIAAQLVLVLVVVRAYQIESRTFFDVAVLAVVGFVVHALLSRAYRLPFFVALSLTGVFVALGWVGGAALLAVGLLLIGACHLPIRWGARVLVLLAMGAVLAAGRADALHFGWDSAVWAILGSMFMFRLALYIQAVGQDGYSFDAYRSLAYFFMLPNVVFPLYPVIDYTAFERNHYDTDALDIYENGVVWVVRGLLQLVLYRVVYRLVVTDAGSLVDLTDLIRHLLGTFLLYLRVSGSFHLVAGMLCLFGFRLPETHHLYFLASGFTDFWRRINIYWKDFMMKLVYYPSFFRLRRWGKERAMILATVVVFFGTWLFHSYQWFWLRGGFPLTSQDVLFWGLLGALVVWTSLREMRRPRKRALGARGWSASLSIRTVGTFVVLCVLWSLWSSDSVVGWLWMWRAAGRADAGDIALLVGLVVAGLVVSGWNWGASHGAASRAGAWLLQPRVRAIVTLVALLGLGHTYRYREWAPWVAKVVASAKSTTLNRRDEELQNRGYYEKLDNPGRMSANLWVTVEARPDDWEGAWQAGIMEGVDGVLGWAVAPSASGEWNGVPVTTNRWGMRDRDYTKAKPEHTRRIAFLGQSHVMGTYVADDEVFDNVLEDRLNADPAYAGTRYEMLNFGATDYSLLQQYTLLTSRVLDFEPDVVALTVAPTSTDRNIRRIIEAARAGWALPPGLDSLVHRSSLDELALRGIPVAFGTIRGVLRRLGIDARMPDEEALVRAREVADDVNVWVIRESARAIREAGAVPVLLALPTVQGKRERLPEMDLAEEAGFEVLDLLDLWEGEPLEEYRVASFDTHPNAAGHRRIADRLYTELRDHALLAAPAADTAMKDHP